MALKRLYMVTDPPVSEEVYMAEDVETAALQTAYTALRAFDHRSQLRMLEWLSKRLASDEDEKS